MERNKRLAFNALKKIGAPVFDTYTNGTPVECGFKISAELAGRDGYFHDNSKDYAPDDRDWAYYYSYDVSGCEDYHFGVHPAITSILNKYGLYAEWENPGCLTVWEA